MNEWKWYHPHADGPKVCDARSSPGGFLACDRSAGHSGDHKNGGPHGAIHWPAAPPKPGLSVAIKADEKKPRFELLDGPALEEVAWVLTAGAKKYEDHNWRKGFAWSRLIGATLRHCFAWLRGENKDPETGRSHLAHAICELMFALNHELTGIGTDDRWKGNP